MSSIEGRNYTLHNDKEKKKKKEWQEPWRLIGLNPCIQDEDTWTALNQTILPHVQGLCPL